MRFYLKSQLWYCFFVLAIMIGDGLGIALNSHGSLTSLGKWFDKLLVLIIVMHGYGLWLMLKYVWKTSAESELEAYATCVGLNGFFLAACFIFFLGHGVKLFSGFVHGPELLIGCIWAGSNLGVYLSSRSETEVRHS